MIDLKGKSVLVSGATGLLGRPLVDKLLQRGARVLGCAYESPRPKDWPKDADYYSVDMSSGVPAGQLIDGIEYIFHLAGAKGGVGIGRTQAATFMLANLKSTMNLLEAMEYWKLSKVQRLLFVSSVGAYPGNIDIFHEDDLWKGPPHESDFFGGCAKRFGEVLCAAYKEQYGLDYVVVRPTNCFGPYDRFDPKTGMVIAALIARIEAGENPLTVWGDGGAARDFLYSKDAAEQMITVMERGESGEAYNLGTGRPYSIGMLLDMLRDCFYEKLEWVYDKSKPSGPSMRCMDMEKTFSLDYGSITGIGKALTETINWYRANKDYAKYDPFK